MTEAEAPYRARVMEATWGHLNPRAGTRYQGHILFAVGCYSDGNAIIESSFGKLSASPVMYELDHSVFDRPEVDDAGVYRYDGAVICYKNGNARLLKGKITKIRLFVS